MAGILRVDQIKNTSGSGNIEIPAGYKLVAADSGAVSAPGTVIQVVSKTWTDVTSLTGATVYAYFAVTNGSQAITSVGANSKFLVILSAQGYTSAGGGLNIGIQRTIGATTTQVLGVTGSSGDAWMGHGNGGSTNSWSITRNYLDSPSQSAGTSITYAALFGNWSTSGTNYFNYGNYGGGSTLTILEIAQ